MKAKFIVIASGIGKTVPLMVTTSQIRKIRICVNCLPECASLLNTPFQLFQLPDRIVVIIFVLCMMESANHPIH